MSYEMHLRSIVVVTLNKIPEDTRKAFEERHMVVEERWGE
jgi:hypothetical protein